MKLKIVSYLGKVNTYDVKSFEFRSNKVSNWIKLIHHDGASEYIHKVYVIKLKGDEEYER